MKYFICLFMMAYSIAMVAQETSDIKLPDPRTTGGKPLMEALKERKTTRDFIEKDLSQQQLSDLLWAGFGINRPDEGKRTAPSAVNWQEIDIYVALKTGVYCWDAATNTLKLVVTGDHRLEMRKQPFVGICSAAIAYVADYEKIGKATDREKETYAAADAAFISQNIYLFCASEGLGTVVLGYIDRDAMAKVLLLKKTQKVVWAQAVGFPKIDQ
jgi:nitroreductase